MSFYTKSAKYKYLAVQDVSTITNIKPAQAVDTPYISLSKNGLLTVKAGYAWDGATGAIDTETFMRGSLVHDALYQLIYEGYLTWSDRKEADKTLYKVCREDGMSRFRAQYVYLAVRMFGKIAMKLRSR